MLVVLAARASGVKQIKAPASPSGRNMAIGLLDSRACRLTPTTNSFQDARDWSVRHPKFNGRLMVNYSSCWHISKRFDSRRDLRVITISVILLLNDFTIDSWLCPASMPKSDLAFYGRRA